MRKIIIWVPHKGKTSDWDTLDKIDAFFGGYMTLTQRSSLNAHYVTVKYKKGGEGFLAGLGLDYYTQGIPGGESLKYEPVIVDHMNIFGGRVLVEGDKKAIHKMQEMIRSLMKEHKVTIKLGDNVYGEGQK